MFNEFIPRKTETTYLGVNLDQRLSFKHHINKTSAKAYAQFHKLYPLFKSPSISIWSKKTLYIMLIRTSMLYGYPAWSFLNKSLFSKLRGLQRSVLRTITGADYVTSNNFLHSVLNIESIEEISSKIQEKFIISTKNHPNYIIQKISN